MFDVVVMAGLRCSSCLPNYVILSGGVAYWQSLVRYMSERAFRESSLGRSLLFIGVLNGLSIWLCLVHGFALAER